jgi:hypothetical protein
MRRLACKHATDLQFVAVDEALIEAATGLGLEVDLLGPSAAERVALLEGPLVVDRIWRLPPRIATNPVRNRCLDAPEYPPRTPPERPLQPSLT